METWRTPGGLDIEASAVSWLATRSGGPGGQHANTSDTAVELTVRIADTGLPADVVALLTARLGETLTVRASDTRSQWRNRELAWARAAERLDAAAVPRRLRRPTRPSRGAVQDRLVDKRRTRDRKQARRRPAREDE